jgi:archaellum component FlaG (FlaF/FlaG flagellin family)
MTGRIRPAGSDPPVVASLLALVLVVAAVASVAVGGVAAQESGAALSLTVDPGEATVAPNGSVTVTLTVENTGQERSVGPVVRLDSLPEGWTVANQTSENATYRSSTREWLWRGLDPGATGEATATLSAPGSAEGTHDLPVSADDAAGATAEAVATVAVGASGDGSGEEDGETAGDGDGGEQPGSGVGAIPGGDGALPLLLGAVGAVVVAGVAVGWYWRSG